MEIVYNMVAYKSKVMHVKYDTINFSSIRYNRNANPREDNNGSKDSSKFLSDYRHLRETVIHENIHLSRNNITEIRG